MQALIETDNDHDEDPDDDNLNFDVFFENDDMEDDESSLSISSLDVEPMKKRRVVATSCRVRRGDKVPRLLVKDIRRIYSTMFVNVINSGNFSLMYGFFDTYYNQSQAQYSLTKYSPGGAEKLFTMSFNGISEVSKYWYSILSVSPDNVVIPLECVIQPSTGKIICKFQKRATHLYQDPPGSAGYYAPHVFVDKKYGSEIVCTTNKTDKDYVVGKASDASTTTTKSSTGSNSGSSGGGGKDMDTKLQAIQEIMDSVDSVVKHLPLQSPPKTVVADGVFIISTDANKRITKIEVKVGF